MAFAPLYASGSRGLVGADNIGAFDAGHAEFYSQDTIDDNSILVKFDGTQLNSATPHFKQSFSSDEGKTREVNWITDQTGL